MYVALIYFILHHPPSHFLWLRLSIIGYKSTVVCIMLCTTTFSETCLVVLGKFLSSYPKCSPLPMPCMYLRESCQNSTPQLRRYAWLHPGLTRWGNVSTRDGRPRSLHTLKASGNRLSTTFRILFKHDQICFKKSVVQTAPYSYLCPKF